MEVRHEEARRTGLAARLKARRGEIPGSNTGIATGVFCNLAVVPKEHATDFYNLCRRNPVPLPLLEQLAPGIHQSALAAESDVSTDIPKYNVYENGTLIKESIDDVQSTWSDNHVGFLLGCSFTLETALAEAGLPARNMLEGKPPPHYATALQLHPSGVFTGAPVVVSMRWYRPEDVDRVRAVSRRLLRQHGEPIAWGWDGAAYLGVVNRIKAKTVDQGEWSEPVGDEVPVFWGCGVTAEYALKTAKLPGITISHRPGSMFVTDLLGEDVEHSDVAR